MKRSLRRRLSPVFGKKGRWLLLAIVVAGLSLWYLVHKMNSPAYGTISVPRTNSAAITDSTDYSTLDTAYFRLLYPSQFSQDYHPAPGGAIVYKYLTVQQGQQPAAVSFEAYIKQLPAGGITLDNDYKSYSADSKNYKASNQLHGTDTLDLFSKDDGGQERNVLWEHGVYLLVIKLHGTPKDQDIDKQIKTIINSVQWLKQ